MIIFTHTDFLPFLFAEKPKRLSHCIGCGGIIHDQFILRVAPDLEWHAACLKCQECRQFLDESCTCFVRDGKTYCKRDYVRWFHLHQIIIIPTCLLCAEQHPPKLFPFNPRRDQSNPPNNSKHDMRSDMWIKSLCSVTKKEPPPDVDIAHGCPLIMFVCLLHPTQLNYSMNFIPSILCCVWLCLHLHNPNIRVTRDVWIFIFYSLVESYHLVWWSILTPSVCLIPGCSEPNAINVASLSVRMILWCGRRVKSITLIVFAAVPVLANWYLAMSLPCVMVERSTARRTMMWWRKARPRRHLIRAGRVTITPALATIITIAIAPNLDACQVIIYYWIPPLIWWFWWFGD